MAYNKIGFHCGPSGNAQGIGDYMARLDAAGIPFVLKSVEDYGVINQSMQYTNAAHVRVFRLSNRKDGGPQFDTPNYDVMPEVAALDHWQMTLGYLPPEFDRSVWLEVINEPDKNRADWLGWFGVEIARLAAIDGYKVALFGFSGGEPEPEHWETAGMIQYLIECARRPNDMAVALHEYSFDRTSIRAGFPWLVGRFQFLHEICDKYSLPYPTILITEWGWEYDNVPGVETAVSHIADIAELYAAYPNILGAGLWYLGGNFGDIHNQAQKLILPVTEYSLVARFPDPPPIDPPNGGDMTLTPENNINWELPRTKPERVKRVRLVAQGNDGDGWQNLPGGVVALDLPEGTKRVVISQMVEDSVNPNPPPVDLLTLPQGALGVDVSFWQGDFNWQTAVMNGTQFGIIRCSDGMTTNSNSHDASGIDRKFWQNAAALYDLGIPWAIYHFLRPGNIAAQAQKVGSVLSTLESIEQRPLTSVFGDGSMLPQLWIDVEDTALSSADIKTFYELLADNYTLGIYTGKPVWDGIHMGVTAWWGNVPLWIAAYGANDGKMPNWTSPNLPLGWAKCQIWQYTSLGGNELGFTNDGLDLNSAGPYAPGVTQPPTPPTDTIDLLEYMIGNHLQQHTLQYTWAGGGTETVQTRITGNEWKIVKGNNGNYEQLYYDANWIYRAEDTSESAERFYTQSTNGTLGAAWVKRHMELGETVYTSKTVQHYLKKKCVPQNGGLVTDKLTLTDIYESLRFDSGIVLDDVIRLEWSQGEGYLFAKGYGLVGFEFSDGKSYISELALSGRDDLPVVVPSCLDLTGRYYV